MSILDKIPQSSFNSTEQIEKAVKAEYQKFFQEPNNQNGFEAPNFRGLMNQSISLPVVGMGVLASGAIQALVTKHFPHLGKWTGIAAGAALIIFGKRQKVLKDFGVGVLLGGVAYAFEGIADSLTNRFNEPRRSFEESRETWGGMDGGMDVMSPERRTIQ